MEASKQISPSKRLKSKNGPKYILILKIIKIKKCTKGNDPSRVHHIQI